MHILAQNFPLSSLHLKTLKHLKTISGPPLLFIANVGKLVGV